MQKYLQQKQEKAAEKKAAVQAMQEKIAQLERESEQPSEGLRQKMEDLKVQFRVKCHQEVRAHQTSKRWCRATRVFCF